MIALTLEQEKELRMTIKSVSFDLDDTFWPLMPTIMDAERNARTWIQENYEAALTSLDRKNSLEIRDQLLRSDSTIVNRLSELRQKIFYEAGIRSGYSAHDSKIMSDSAFEIFFKGRNKVTFYDGVIEILELLKKDYSLGVVTNGNADLKMIGIDHYFDYILSPVELNAHKPDPAMFDAVLDITGLDRSEICHIGDHPVNDVKASYDFGLKAIWFNENEEEFPIKDIKVPEFSDWKKLPEMLKAI